MISKLLLVAVLFLPLPAWSALKAVATTPDVAWLVKRVGGSEVEVKSLARSRDNYHFLDARPDYILAVNRADLLCQVGADLEMAWLPKVVEKAANKKVMPGEAGNCVLSRAVSLEERSVKVDRSMGDVHPSGNPHFWLSPLAMGEAAKEVEAHLSLLAPEKAKFFAANRERVEQELKSLSKELSLRLEPLSGKGFYQYHKEFTYFLSAYGLKLLGSIEEVPGVSPSAARLGKVGLAAKREKAVLALAGEHDPSSVLAKFTELSSVPHLQLPTSLSSPDEEEAYRKWQEKLVAAILKAAP